MLPCVSDEAQLQEQEEWLANQVQSWLNDEWTELSIHQDLGRATAKVRSLYGKLRFNKCSQRCLISYVSILQAYRNARSQGKSEIGEVLLSISSDLLSFNFRETFVNAFDVSQHAIVLPDLQTWPTLLAACRYQTRLQSC